MERLEKLLSVGDRRSIGKTEEVIGLVLSNEEPFDGLIRLMFSDNPCVSMRASDAVEKITRVYPEWLMPHKDTLLKKIINVNQKEVRWHAAQILPRMDLTKKERGKVYELMLDYLKDESRIVKSFAMQALTDIAIQDPSYVKKVKPLIQNTMEHGAPSQKSRGRKLLAILEKMNLVG